MISLVLKMIGVVVAVAGVAAGAAALIKKIKERKKSGEPCPLCEKVKALLHRKQKEPVYYFERFDDSSDQVVE